MSKNSFPPTRKMSSCVLPLWTFSNDGYYNARRWCYHRRRPRRACHGHIYCSVYRAETSLCGGLRQGWGKSSLVERRSVWIADSVYMKGIARPSRQDESRSHAWFDGHQIATYSTQLFKLLSVSHAFTSVGRALWDIHTGSKHRSHQ